MPKTSEPPETTPPASEESAPDVLLPFSVILDGQDRTIFAKDHDDLQVRIARLRATSPLNDGQ